MAPDSLSADLGITLHFGLTATWKFLKSRKDMPIDKEEIWTSALRLLLFDCYNTAVIHMLRFEQLLGDDLSKNSLSLSLFRKFLGKGLKGTYFALVGRCTA